MPSSFEMERQEIQYLLVATLVAGAAFSAYKQIMSPVPALVWTGIAALVIITRELGQRSVAQGMHAYVDTELSAQGAGVTILAAILAYLTQLPVIALFPLSSSFSGERHEQWGKSIDAIWMKRQFWMVAGGLVALFLGWLVAFGLGFSMAAEAFIIFLFFQLLPLDYPEIPTGALDGAYVLRWSGFIWLGMMGVTLVGLLFTL